jgi:probable O-glycosylation ligase (exosortase A-associated)
MKGLLFTYLLTFGGGAAALFRPFIGLLVYVCFSILRPEALWPWAVPPGNYSKIVAIALLLGWAFKGFGRWQLGRAQAVMVMLAAFALWAVVALNFATADREAAWTMVEELLKVIIPVFVGISTIDSVRQLQLLAWVMVLSEGYVALEFNLSYLGGYNRVQYEGFGSLDNNGVAVGLVACLGIAFFLGIPEKRWPLKAAALGAGLLMIHAILLSFSRGGMLSMGITSLVAFVLVPKRPVYYAAFVLAALAVARLAGPQVIERFQQTFVEKGEDASADTRRAQWAACLRCIQDHPLGIGPDQWKFINGGYGVQQGIAAHSTWMQVGVEFGLPGLAALLLYYGLCMARLRPLVREATPVPDPWFHHLARMVITSLSGFMIAAQFVTLYKLEIPYYVALIGASLLKMTSTPPVGAPPALSYVPVYGLAGPGSPPLPAPGSPPGGAQRRAGTWSRLGLGFAHPWSGGSLRCRSERLWS